MKKEEKIKKLIALGEGQNLEFKESLSKFIKKEICAFANAEGGKIIIGATDDGRIKGFELNNKSSSQLQAFISELTPKLNITFEEKEGVVVVDIPSGKKEDKPYSIDNKFYIREGSNSQTLTRNEIKEYFTFGENNGFDGLLNKEFKEDVDFEL